MLHLTFLKRAFGFIVVSGVACLLAAAWLQAAPLKTAVPSVSKVSASVSEKARAARGKKGIAALPAAEQIMVRVRVAELAPSTYAQIKWHWGGGALVVGMGDPVVGDITGLPPQPAPDAGHSGDGKDFIPDTRRGENFLWVKKGVWLAPVPLGYFQLRGFPFVTFVVRGRSERKARTIRESVDNCTLEFELSYQGKVIKTFKESSKVGGYITAVFPVRKLGPNGAPSPVFLDEVGGLLQYSQRRLESLTSLPWAKRPVPKLYCIATDCFGYNANNDVSLAELMTTRQLGVNGLRVMPGFLSDLVAKKEGIGKEFSKCKIGGTPDYLVPRLTKKNVEGAGCPYNPATLKTRPGQIYGAVLGVIAKARQLSVDEEWLLSQDEIGAFYSSVKHTEHLATCPYCQQAFRDYVKELGYKPEDFGAKEWKDIKTSGGYIADLEKQGYVPASKKIRIAKSKAKAAAAPAAPGGEDREEAADDDGEAGDMLPAVRGNFKLPVSDHGFAMAKVLTRQFNNETSARLFEQQHKMYTDANAMKLKAVKEGKTDSPEAKQPWLYFYALRRSSFIMGGDVLDYFDFYRKADTGFMYETSDRDPRAWPWDSLMSDVGRVLQDKFGTRYAMCLKPHRGAPIERALAAISRNAKMIYWYTYGPNWAKGDGFSGALFALKKCSWVARVIAAAEDVTYDAKWAYPSEVALVRLRTSEIFEGSTSWENGKWIYSALMHAHIPVDPLSESMLLDQNLSQYKVIYVSGTNIRNATAEKLMKWIENGGTLYVSGGGLAKDEGNQPFAAMQAVLGLKARKPMEEWRKMPRYGSVGLGKLRELQRGLSPNISVKGIGELTGEFPVLAGREVLDPVDGTTVLARFSDNGVAATRHAYGKGQAYVVGFYAGVEYSVEVQGLPYDTAKAFKPEKRGYVTLAARQAGVKPIVDASEAVIEGVLLKNAKSGRQAVVLINWAYAVDDDRDRSATDFSNLKVTIHPAGKVTKVRSTALEQDVPFVVSGEYIVVTLPKMEEGEILLLD